MALDALRTAHTGLPRSRPHGQARSSNAAVAASAALFPAPSTGQRRAFDAPLNLARRYADAAPQFSGGCFHRRCLLRPQRLNNRVPARSFV